MVWKKVRMGFKNRINNLMENIKKPRRMSGMYGKHHSEETKKKLSEKGKSYKNPKPNGHSEVSRKKIGEYRKNSVWIHKDGHCKSILKSELIFWEDAGWLKGRR
jgi:hypothetical protein